MQIGNYIQQLHQSYIQNTNNRLNFVGNPSFHGKHSFDKLSCSYDSMNFIPSGDEKFHPDRDKRILLPRNGQKTRKSMQSRIYTPFLILLQQFGTGESYLAFAACPETNRGDDNACDMLKYERDRRAVNDGLT